MKDVIRKHFLELWEEFVDSEQTDTRWSSEEDLTFEQFIKWLKN